MCNGCRIQVKKGDNLNDVKHEANRTFRNKKREYLKEKINDHQRERTKTSEAYIKT
jgi:hypothetical protein